MGTYGASTAEAEFSGDYISEGWEEVLMDEDYDGNPGPLTAEEYSRIADECDLGAY